MVILRLLGGLGVMRKKLLVCCGLFALIGAITAAVLLGIAGIGKAASTNTCAYTVGTPPTTVPNCLTVGVFPGQLSPTGRGLIVAKFENKGSATATHTTITVNLPSNVAAGSTPCAVSSPPTGGTAVTCSVGNIAGFGTAKVAVQFTTSATTSLAGISATVSYAEGNGSNGNDTFTAQGNSISIVDGTANAGDCTDTTGGTLDTHLGLQTTSIDSLPAISGLPCTPIAGGVVQNPGNLNCGAARCTSSVSYVIVPTTGTATLLIPLSSLPNGTTDKKFVLYWFPETGAPPGIALTLCPTPAAPTPGTDTCIKSQTGVTIAGVKYIKDVLTVFGTGISLIDSKFAG
jgi:hypothetical protein